MHGLQRGGGKGAACSPELDRFWSGVAQGLADGNRQLWDSEKNFVFTGGGGLCLGDDVAAHCVQSRCRQAVIVAAPAELAGDHRADPLAHRHQSCGLFIQLVAWMG